MVTLWGGGVKIWTYEFIRDTIQLITGRYTWVDLKRYSFLYTLVSYAPNLLTSFFPSTRGWTQGLMLARQALKHSTTSASCKPVVGYVWDKVSLYLQAGLGLQSFFVLPCLAEITTSYHALSHWLRWGLTNIFSQAGLKPWSLGSLPPE
jgi:hypothetical protein